MSWPALLSQGVAGEGFAQLGNGAEVAGVELEKFGDGLAALHHMAERCERRS